MSESHGIGWRIKNGEDWHSLRRARAKLNSEYYCQHVLGGGLLPDNDIRARCQCWILQQDGAPSHTARNTLTYLRRENVKFIEPDMWTQNSPDLNPVDYALQQMVYQRRGFTTINQLKQAIVIEWDKLSQRFIDRAIMSRHWSVASPAWVRRPAARRTHWTHDVKTAWCDSYCSVDNNWDNKHVVSCCYCLKMCCYRSRLVFNCCF